MERLDLPGGSHLRLLELSDVEELHALIEAERARLGRWLPWAEAQTLEDTAGFIRRTREQLAANDGFQLALICEGQIGGVIGFHGIDWSNRTASLGYWLGEAWQGVGRMTEAVSLLTEHALSAWDLNRVEIRVAVDNRPSRAIPERLGFREEATMRKAERVGERHLDCVVYSVVRP